MSHLWASPDIRFGGLFESLSLGSPFSVAQTQQDGLGLEWWSNVWFGDDYNFTNFDLRRPILRALQMPLLTRSRAYHSTAVGVGSMAQCSHRARLRKVEHRSLGAIAAPNRFGHLALLIALSLCNGCAQDNVDPPDSTSYATEAVRQNRTSGASAAEVSAAETEQINELVGRLDASSLFELSHLYDRSPEAVLTNESAARIIARTADRVGDSETIERVDQTWNGRQTAPHAWLCVDADRLIGRGESDAAIHLLESKEFSGANDVGRLVRLAGLVLRDDPTRSAELLARAVEKAPRTADARLFLGQLYEAAGRMADARVEYVAAVASEPANPSYRLALAEFYRRRGNYRFALDTLEELVQIPGGEVGRGRLLFWARVAEPRDLPVAIPSADDDEVNALESILRRLPEFAFWDEAALVASVDGVGLSRRSQEVHWLRVLEHLRGGEDEESLKLVKKNRFASDNWNPLLQDALQSLLSFRLEGRFAPSQAADTTNNDSPLHPLIDILLSRENSQVTAETRAFLHSQEAIPAVLLATGWTEAALRMPCADRCPNEAPHHLAFAMCQAYRRNRSLSDALAFALCQPADPEIDLVIGEMRYANGEREEAISSWRSAAADSGPVGYRASYLLAVELAGRGKSDEAVQVVGRHDLLAASTTGKELLAKLAMQRGDKRRAEALAKSAYDKSIEFQLAEIRRLVAAGDVAAAKQIAVPILHEYPDSVPVRRLMRDLQLAEQGIKAGR